MDKNKINNKANETSEMDEAPGLSAPINGKKIYLVRHGKTEWNKTLRYQGITNIPLSEEGLEQARKVGLRFANAKVDVVISSPLRRACETAECIARHHSLKIETLDLLKEVNFGEWEGLTVKEIIARCGSEFFYKWRCNQLHVGVKGGEDMDELSERSRKAAEILLKRPEMNIVVVGHGAMLRSLLLPLLGLPRSNIFWKTRIENCSISAVTLEGKSQFVLAFMNDTLHLRVAESDIKMLPLL